MYDMQENQPVLNSSFCIINSFRIQVIEKNLGNNKVVLVIRKMWNSRFGVTTVHWALM